MKTKTINLYEYHELDEFAKDVIRNKWREFDLMDDYNYEYRQTLERFSEICNINVFEWEVGIYGAHHFRFKCEGYPYEIYDNEGYVDDYIELASLSGKLLFRYISHTIIPYIVKRKTYWKNWPKKRTSRILYDCYPEQGSCPLTGVCMDCDIIEPLMKYYRNWAKYAADYTFEDLMNECLESFFSAWENEYEWRYTDEAIDEVIESNWDDKLFFEDGTEYCGELDEIA